MEVIKKGVISTKSGIESFTRSQTVYRCTDGSEDTTFDCPFLVRTSHLDEGRLVEEGHSGLCSVVSYRYARLDPEQPPSKEDLKRIKETQIKVFEENRKGITSSCPAYSYNLDIVDHVEQS